MKIVTCPYCSNGAVLVDSAEVYNGRSYGMIYLCRPCHAYVGVHKSNNNPLGRLADAELRKAKIAAHNAFDPLWRTGNISRKSAYKKLANYLGIEGKDCHIGMFDVDMCVRVLGIKAYLRKRK